MQPNQAGQLLGPKHREQKTSTNFSYIYTFCTSQMVSTIDQTLANFKETKSGHKEKNIEKKRGKQKKKNETASPLFPKSILT